MPVEAGDSVIIDIGGGSTELSFISSGQFKTSISLPMGVIAPTEQCMHTDPPTNAFWTAPNIQGV